MICVSLGNISFEACLQVLGRVEMAELRLDLLTFSLDQLRTVFSSHPRLIATYRPGKVSVRKRKTFLIEAINAGARYVDLDIEADGQLLSEIKKYRQKKDCQLIISYHNFQATPPAAELRRLVRRAFSRGADVVKVACFCRELRDNARLLALLDEDRPVVVCGMGPAGAITRVAACWCGSPFTYAYWEGKNPTAAGQLSYQRLKKVYALLGAKPGGGEKAAVRQ